MAWLRDTQDTWPGRQPPTAELEICEYSHYVLPLYGMFSCASSKERRPQHATQIECQVRRSRVCRVRTRSIRRGLAAIPQHALTDVPSFILASPTLLPRPYFDVLQ
jgi:hypothetical protein